MCLIVFAWQQHCRWPLLLAANRDEFHARPAAPAAFWDDHPDVLAGRDLQAGGTWLGVTAGGRFAAITNIRDPGAGERRAPRSRGELTTDFLTGGADPGRFLNDLAPRVDDYLGFNLLVGDGHSLWYLHGDGTSTPRSLPAGLYGLSNAALDVPWPKVRLARQRLELVLDSARGSPDHGQLRSCTADRALAADGDLALDTADDAGMLRALSAQFIVTPAYGTRCMTTLRMAENGNWDFVEQRFGASGKLAGESRFSMPCPEDRTGA